MKFFVWALALGLVLGQPPMQMGTAQPPETTTPEPAPLLAVVQGGLTIVGPDSVKPGSLVVLTCNASAQANVLWFLGNSDESYLPILNGTSHQCVFATGQEGVYRFIAVAAVCADGKLTQEKDEHLVTVGKPAPVPPGPGPGPGPNPNPNPPGPVDLPIDFDGIATKARDWGLKVAQDSRSAARDLAKIYQDASDGLGSGKFVQITDAAKHVTTETDKVLVGDKKAAWKDFGSQLNMDFASRWSPTPMTRDDVAKYFFCVSQGLLAAAP